MSTTFTPCFVIPVAPNHGNQIICVLIIDVDTTSQPFDISRPKGSHESFLTNIMEYFTHDCLMKLFAVKKKFKKKLTEPDKCYFSLLPFDACYFSQSPFDASQMSRVTPNTSRASHQLIDG